MRQTRSGMTVWHIRMITPLGDNMSLLYGLQKQGEAYLFPISLRLGTGQSINQSCSQSQIYSALQSRCMIACVLSYRTSRNFKYFQLSGQILVQVSLYERNKLYLLEYVACVWSCFCNPITWLLYSVTCLLGNTT